jgi:hypothetical protein
MTDTSECDVREDRDALTNWGTGSGFDRTAADDDGEGKGREEDKEEFALSERVRLQLGQSESDGGASCVRL